MVIKAQPRVAVSHVYQKRLRQLIELICTEGYEIKSDKYGTPVELNRPAVPPPPEWRVRHVKRGSEYDVIGEARLQTSAPLNDMDIMVVYRGSDGKMWVRSETEFYDGRFVAAAVPDEQQESEK